MLKIRIIAAILIVLMIGVSGCGMLSREDSKDKPPDINPNAEAANYDTSDVTLYFSYRGEYLLAGETRSIDVPVSDPLEAAIIRELIEGPSADRDELAGLFWEDVELVDVDSFEGVLLVTLSENFVSTKPEGSEFVIDEGTVDEQKKLAIYSIVNTLIEMGTYSSVQIYVVREGGVARRITKSEAGWSNESGTLDLLGRDESIILTPENTLKKALDSFGNKDWLRLYNFTAYRSHDGTKKPDIEDFSKAFAAERNILDSFNVVGTSVSANGQKVVVMLDYTIKTREGDTIPSDNRPVVLLREKDIWKLSYISLANVLINS